MIGSDVCQERDCPGGSRSKKVMVNELKEYINCKDNRRVIEGKSSHDRGRSDRIKAAPFIPRRHTPKYCAICGDQISSKDGAYCFSCRAFLLRKKVVLKSERRGQSCYSW